MEFKEQGLTSYTGSVFSAGLWRTNEEGLKEVESLIADIREFREFRKGMAEGWEVAEGELEEVKEVKKVEKKVKN